LGSYHTGSNMRILVDYRPALRARTGVGEYTHEMVRAYTAAHAGSQGDQVTLFTSSWKDRPEAELGAELGAEVVDRRIPVRALNYLWHRAEWPPVETLAGRFDIAHSAHPLLMPARHAAQVVTIHDLFFLSNPERTGREIRRDYAALSGSHARRADAVITSSHHVRQLVSSQFDVPADRIYVCPPGAPSWRRLGQQPRAPLDGAILFLGTLEPRKNLGLLLDAYETLAQKMSAVPRLVLAGAATPEAAPWLERIARPPLQGHVVHFGYVPDHQREGMYAGARVLVLPSHDEGFGLPVLEAMAAGIPVIVTNRGSLPEVVGDAGVIVEPDDVEGLARAIARVVLEPAWAADRGQASLDRARHFTWTTTAATLRQAYRDALARRQERGRR
jgi:glycosyltransferase involved in cell wall biosynthesis